MSTVQGFISYDQPDGLGIRAQVVVTKGALPVKRITLNEAETMAKIDFDAEAGALKFPIHANVPVDSPAFAVLKAAKESGQPVNFRIESQRKKKGVDRRFPFPPAKEADREKDVRYLETQGGKEVVKILVAAGDVVTTELRTNPDEDQRWSSIERSMAPAFIDENASPAASTGGTAFDKEVAFAGYRAAAQAGCSQDFLNTVAAVCVAFGVSFDEVKALAADVKKG